MTTVPLGVLIEAARTGTALVSFPTDTVLALAIQPAAADKIFALKQRPPEKPLILMGARAEDLWPWVAGSGEEREQWRRVAQRYWPGALTLVLPAGEGVPAAINPLDRRTLGLRVPNHALARKILAATGPLATTSVNRSGQPPLQTLAEVADHFPTVLIPQGEALGALEPGTLGPSGIPSTVVQWFPSGWQVLRQGAVPWEAVPPPPSDRPHPMES